MLPGASMPLILLHWVIFKSSFSKHLLSIVHCKLLFHMLCLYCGCGCSGAEPGCFQQTSGSYMVHHAKFKISNKFNMYSAGIRCLLQSAECSDSLSWGLSGRPQSGPIQKHHLEDGGKRKAKSRADADNVYSDQATKAEALTQDHQDKLSLAGKGERVLHCAPSPWPQPQAQTISMT